MIANLESIYLDCFLSFQTDVSPLNPGSHVFKYYWSRSAIDENPVRRYELYGVQLIDARHEDGSLTHIGGQEMPFRNPRSALSESPALSRRPNFLH
jgi:hypothetical protein